MAQMAAMDAYIRQSGEGLAAWTRMKAEDQPDLKGAMTYIQSPRHANYVDVATYRRVLTEIREKFGWPDPDDQIYEGMKPPARAPSEFDEVILGAKSANAIGYPA